MEILCKGGVVMTQNKKNILWIGNDWFTPDNRHTQMFDRLFGDYKLITGPEIDFDDLSSVSEISKLIKLNSVVAVVSACNSYSYITVLAGKVSVDLFYPELLPTFSNTEADYVLRTACGNRSLNFSKFISVKSQNGIIIKQPVM